MPTRMSRLMAKRPKPRMRVNVLVAYGARKCGATRSTSATTATAATRPARLRGGDGESDAGGGDETAAGTGWGEVLTCASRRARTDRADARPGPAPARR